jgi:apolipoprotein N-acyltransferase
VVRAVETRRPVIRDGNAGWSGWIDEYGVIKYEAKDARGRVYFRGHQVADIQRDVAWVGRQSFYVQHGDWFVVVSGALVVGAVLLLRSPRFRFSQ